MTLILHDDSRDGLRAALDWMNDPESDRETLTVIEEFYGVQQAL